MIAYIYAFNRLRNVGFVYDLGHTALADAMRSGSATASLGNNFVAGLANLKRDIVSRGYRHLVDTNSFRIEFHVDAEAMAALERLDEYKKFVWFSAEDNQLYMINYPIIVVETMVPIWSTTPSPRMTMVMRPILEGDPPSVIPLPRQGTS